MPHNINSDRMFLPNALLLGEVEKTLADGRSVALNATGNSMLPFIIGGVLFLDVLPVVLECLNVGKSC